MWQKVWFKLRCRFVLHIWLYQTH